MPNRITSFKLGTRQILLSCAIFNIHIKGYSALPRRNKEAMRGYYIANAHPLITPQAIDNPHPFPFVANLSLNLFGALRKPGKGKITRARIKVPVGAGVPKFVQLPLANRHARTNFVKCRDILAQIWIYASKLWKSLTVMCPALPQNANKLANYSNDVQASGLNNSIFTKIKGIKQTPATSIH